MDSKDVIAQELAAMNQRMAQVEICTQEALRLLKDQAVQKEWYTTVEVAKAMNVSQYTVQARWCGEGRIEAVKDPETRKWMIPGREYRRLTSGGGLRSAGHHREKHSSDK